MDTASKQGIVDIINELRKSNFDLQLRVEVLKDIAFDSLVT